MVNLQYNYEVPEDVFENPLIGFHLKCMRAFGYIVSKQQRNKNFHLRKGHVFMASYIVFSCLIFIRISRGFTSLADSATTYAAAFTWLSFTVSVVNAFYKRERVVRMIIFLHEDIAELFRITDKEEEIMLAKTIQYLRIIMSTMWTPSLMASFILSLDCVYRTFAKPETVFNMPQVRNGTAQPILLFQILPFGEVYDNFVVGYLAPFYALFLGVSTISCWHTFVACLMKFIVLKYDILHKRMSEYDFSKISLELEEEQLNSLIAKDLQYWHTKMCRFCVWEQIKLKWFAEELESVISIPVFLDFIMFSVLMCFLFYAFAVGDPSNIDCAFYAIYLFVIVFLLWIYHWHATLVTESVCSFIPQLNDRLCFGLYSSPWYTFPVNIQKNILLMMMKTNKPLIMKAMFVQLNLKTLIDVIRGAYSYFNILRNASLESN